MPQSILIMFQKIKTWWFVLVLFIVFLGIILLFAPSQQENNPVLKPSESPQDSITIHPPRTIGIIGISPKSGINYMGETTSSLSVIFSESIEKTDFDVISIPPLLFKTKVSINNKNKIIITPKTVWRSDTDYTITISKEIRNKHTKTLDFLLNEDIVLSYTVKSVNTFLPGEFPEGNE